MSKQVEVPVGSVFGRLTTISLPFYRIRSDGRNRSFVTVTCVCDGKHLEVSVSNLKAKDGTRSCGCLQKELAAASLTTHGYRGGDVKERYDKLYQVWKRIRYRCSNPNADNYKWYGGKGIKVCETWGYFPTFQYWALSNNWQDGLELDRIDSNKDYEPNNCRWVTKKQNIRNRDFAWDDLLDAKLVAYATSINQNPYDIIRKAVEIYLENNVN